MKKILYVVMIVVLAAVVPVGQSAFAQDSAVVAQVDRAVDLNKATAAEFETLPGIGPAIAERIVAYRDQQGRFGSIEELKQVKGIGSKTFEKLSGLVVIQ